MKFLLPRFLACLLLLAIHIHVQAQELPKDASLTEMHEFILEQKFSDPEGAHTNAETLLQRSKLKKNPDYIFKAYRELGRIANIEGDYNKSIAYSKLAGKIADSLKNDDYLCATHLLKGTSLVYLGNDNEALKCYLKALEHAKKSKNIKYQIMARGNLAKVKRNIHFDEEALVMFKENLKLCKKNKLDKELIGINTYLGLTGTFLTLSKPDSTLVYAEIGLTHATSNNDVEGQSYFFMDMGIAHFIKGEFDKAISYLKQAEEITLGLNNKKRLVEMYYYIGKSYAEMKVYDKAIQFLEHTKETITKENSKNDTSIRFNPHILLKTYETLADVYKKQGNIEASNTSFEQYNALDKIKDSNRTTVYESLLKNVNKENEELISSESRLKEILKITFWIVGVILIFCFFFIWKYIKMRKKNKVIFEQLMKKIEAESYQKKKAHITIRDKKVQEILMRLDKLETSLYFLNSNCSLQNVAKKIKTNTSYLSKIIGTHKQKKFTEYINELRIQYVLKRLKEDAKFRKYAIKNIALEIGYKSTNSFTKHFKAHTKLYPSFYIQTLNEKEKNSNANL